MDKSNAVPRRHNLALPLNHFVGREGELDVVQNLLHSHRLLTLTGPSGCGKTRLAVEHGRSALDSYADGIWLLDFSLLDDSSQIFPLMSRTINITSEGQLTIEERLLEYFQPRHCLLIFDNCEHVIVEAARAAWVILSSAAHIKIIATSQALLGLPGEMEWIVPSLSMPSDGQATSNLDEMREYAAPRLFAERAAEVRAGFSLTQSNIAVVLEICRRLDGIPLALELAAARVKMLSLSEINTGLDDRFRLLVNPQRFTSRHQTLQSAIDWSYALLTAHHQVLLNRLGVFRGPWTMEAAKEVISDSSIPTAEVLQRVGELVDRSFVILVRAERPEDSSLGITHYRLLESVRLYALAHLSMSEQTDLRRQHLRWYSRFAQLADSHLRGAEQVFWIQAIEDDLPNLTEAIEYASQSSEADENLLLGLRLASGIAWYALGRSSADLIFGWLEKLFRQAEAAQGPEWAAARAYAQYLLARYYWLKNNHPIAKKYQQKSREDWASLGEAGRKGYAMATNHLGMIAPYDLQESSVFYREALEIFRELGDAWGQAEATFHLAVAAHFAGDLAQAEPLYQQALALFSQLGDLRYQGLANINLFHFCLYQARYADALKYNQEALRCFTPIRFLHGLNLATSNHGDLLLAQKAYAEAEQAYREAIKLNEQCGLKDEVSYDYWRIAQTQINQHLFEKARLSALTAVRMIQHVDDPSSSAGYYLLTLAAALVSSHPLQAARIHGKALKALEELEKSGEALLENDILPAEELLKSAATTGRVGLAAYQRAQTEGASLSLDELLSTQPAEEPSDREPDTHARSPRPLTELKAEKARFAGLTAREREVAVLITHGLTNSSIADQMMLSERTVTTHISNILSKLGYTSRTQIAAWAVEKGLVSPSGR